jgi:hypothetical protein
MSELDDVAKGRASASGQEIVEQLRHDMEAFHRKQSAGGMLRSGNTVVESRSLCARALDRQGEAITTHFGWVIKEGLWTSKSKVDALVSEARNQLEPVLGTSRELMKMAADRAGSPKLAQQFIEELERHRDRVWTNVDLALRAIAAELNRRNVKGSWKSLVQWLVRLFRGG